MPWAAKKIWGYRTRGFSRPRPVCDTWNDGRWTQCWCLNRFQAFKGDACYPKIRTLGAVPAEIERHCKAPFDVVKTYLERLDWEMLPHLPYSRDIVPSYYYLFWLMSYALAEKRFQSFEDIKKWVYSWIASKYKEFFGNVIRKLSEKWRNPSTRHIFKRCILQFRRQLFTKRVNISITVKMSKFDGHTFKAYNLIHIKRNADFYG